MSDKEVMDQPIKTIEQAETFYKMCGCSSYHMWHDYTDRYEEYLSLNIPKDTELMWTEQQYESLSNEMASTPSTELWWLFYRLCENAKAINTLEILNKTYIIAKELVNRIPNENIPHLLSSVIGNNAAATHGGLIESTFELGEKELAQNLIGLSKELIDKAEACGVDVLINREYLDEVILFYSSKKSARAKSNSTDINIKKGRTILLIIICSILLFDGVLTALTTHEFGLQRLSHGILRFLVTATFMYFIYKGKRRIKNIFVGLLLFAIITTLTTCDMSILSNPLMLLLLFVYATSAILLMFSKSVKCFFEVASNKE